MTDLLDDVEEFEAQLRIADDGPQVTTQLATLLRNIAVGGKQVHDADIVATMLAHGISHHLTHNTSDFARFAHLITVVPLVITS